MSTFLEELDEIVGPVESQEYAEARLALDIAVQFTALRERRGLTQRQLADRLGRTQQAVSKIENPSHGGHNLARLKVAVSALDAALDVTIVPLEDLAAYEACRPPKPTLEDVHRRLDRERSTARRPGRAACAPQGPNRVKVSRRLRKPGGRRHRTADDAASRLVTAGGSGDG